MAHQRIFSPNIAKTYRTLYSACGVIARTVNRQIFHNKVADILFHQLEYENAKDEYKWVLTSVLHTKGLSPYISACKNDLLLMILHR